MSARIGGMFLQHGLVVTPLYGTRRGRLQGNAEDLWEGNAEDLWE